MKRLLLALALLLAPLSAYAQCNGVFPNNTVCGNVSGAGNLPAPTPPSSFLGAAGGTNGQIQYNNSSALGGLTDSQVAARTQPYITGFTGNLLQNTLWRLWTSGTLSNKATSNGTGLQTQVSCTGFTTATQNPVSTCANTQQIRVGDYVVSSIQNFWGFAGASYIGCSGAKSVQCYGGSTGYVTAAKVTAVVANTSVTVTSPGFNGVSPAASSASTWLPFSIYGSGIYGPDGWNKSSTLVATVDDWGTAALPASTAYPGCERPLLLRKGITGQETFTYNIPAGMVPMWRGQTVSFGAVVYQRVQGGTGTWNLHIDDSAGSGSSLNGTGASFGGYQFQPVTYTISTNATAVALYINLLGNAGDVFDVCLPTALFASSIGQNQLGANIFEITRANGHWNPPLLTPLIIDFPSVELVTGSGLYGWNGIDLEAISLSQVHNAPATYNKIEWTTPNVNAIVFTGAKTSIVPGNNLSHCQEATTQVANIMFPTAIARCPTYHDGTFTIFTNVSGLVMSGGTQSGTWDFGDIDNQSYSSIN